MTSAESGPSVKNVIATGPDLASSPPQSELYLDLRFLPVRSPGSIPEPPAEVYASSSRRYHGLPDLAYPLHDRDVLVTACGRICMHRKRVNISTVLAGQRLGIKEVDEGIWLVSFMSYDLGFIDLEQNTLQPLDNPFGPRLSPMS